MFSAAGAEPPLILRADGMVERMEITGMPLGIQPETVYTVKTAWLRTLVEQAGPTSSLQELSQAIYRGARDFVGRALHDDVCLLLARRWWAV